MTGTTEIKVRLDPGLKKQFEKTCRDGGSSMTAEISHLILAAINREAEFAEADQDALPQPRPVDQGALPTPSPTDLVLERLEDLSQQVEKVQAGRPHSDSSNGSS